MKVYIVGLIFMLSIISGQIAAQECVDYRDYSHIVGTVETPGIATNLVVSGDHVYMADRTGGLQIIDVSEPGPYAIAGSLDVGAQVPSLAQANGLIYLAAYENGVVIVDVSSPDTPLPIGSVDGFFRAVDIVVHGPVALVADVIPGAIFTGEVVIVDVSNSSTPLVVGRIPQSSTVVAVDGDGQTGVAVGPDIGLVVFNYSTPATPFVTATLPLSYGNNDVAMAGGRAYVAGGDDGLYIVDISNPAVPVLVHTVLPDLSAGAYFEKVNVVGNQLLVSGFGAGFSTYDLADPDLPVLISQIHGRSNPNGMTADADRIYGATGNPGGLVVMNHGLSPFELVTKVDTGFNAVVATSGNLAMIGQYESTTLEIFDITDPQLPTLLATHALPSFPAGIEIVDHFAYCTSYGMGLTILDISDPGQPVEIAYHGLTEPRDLVVDGSTVFVADGPAGLAVIDVSTPTAPVGIGNYPTTSFAFRLAIQAGYAYLGASSIHVLDVSNPTGPVLVTEISATANDLFTGDGLLYVADNWLGLSLFDITDPANPAFVSELLTPYAATRLTVENQIVYLADGWGGLAAVDTHIPAEPQFLGGAYLPHIATDVAVYGDWVLTTSTTGLYVLPRHCLSLSTVQGDASLPAKKPVLFHNYPNPFNPQTAIAFDLPKQTAVSLRVFDISGRLVRVLVDGEATEFGLHEIIWNGRDDSGRQVATGVYFYRLEAEEYSETCMLPDQSGLQAPKVKRHIL